mmetsp:Transcript_5353/g.9287  ORF Transcript_5353/g.9287 Transcript_5353/m.9287 type:complete len:203 (-) Transcript_5353:46-654(-)
MEYKNYNSITLGEYDFKIYWHGSSSILEKGLSSTLFSKQIQSALLNDGSLTRQLQLLTNQPIKVELVNTFIDDKINIHLYSEPNISKYINRPYVHRQVWLSNYLGKPLAFAMSYWAISNVDKFLPNQKLPIWTNLSGIRTEVSKELLGIFYGNSTQLEITFKEKGPFWGRYYMLWHKKQPLTLIYEIFSSSLLKKYQDSYQT